MRKTLLRNDTYEQINKRLDELNNKVHDTDFISSKRKANEVNCWVFDYPPQHEMIARERIEDMITRNKKGIDNFKIYNYRSTLIHIVFPHIFIFCFIYITW